MRVEVYSMEYYLRLEKGKKVVIGSTSKDLEIVEIADEQPDLEMTQLLWGYEYKRLVKHSSGETSMQFTHFMRYCRSTSDSLKPYPLGKINELPLTFDHFIPKGGYFWHTIEKKQKSFQLNDYLIVPNGFSYDNKFASFLIKERAIYYMEIKDGIILPFLFISEFGAELSEPIHIEIALKNKSIPGQLSDYPLYTMRLEEHCFCCKLKNILERQNNLKDNLSKSSVSRLPYILNPNNVRFLNPDIETYHKYELMVNLDIEHTENIKLLKEAEKAKHKAFEQWSEANSHSINVRMALEIHEYGEAYVRQALALNMELDAILKNTNNPAARKKEIERIAALELENKEEEVESLLVSELYDYSGESDVLNAIFTMKLQGNKLCLPTEKWDKKLYTSVKKMLTDSDFKYKQSAFIHASDARLALSQIFELDGMNPKKKFQFFRSTSAIKAVIKSLIEIEGITKALEPSAGDGALIEAIRDAGYEGVIDAYEAWDKNRAILAEFENVRVLGDDFLKAKGLYQLIVANPPFSGDQDIKHISKMFEMLEVGGTVISVASTSWRTKNNGTCKAFRKLIANNNAQVIEMPEGTFAESGTNVPTVIIKIIKK